MAVLNADGVSRAWPNLPHPVASFVSCRATFRRSAARLRMVAVMPGPREWACGGVKSRTRRDARRHPSPGQEVVAACDPCRRDATASGSRGGGERPAAPQPQPIPDLPTPQSGRVLNSPRSPGAPSSRGLTIRTTRRDRSDAARRLGRRGPRPGRRGLAVPWARFPKCPIPRRHASSHAWSSSGSCGRPSLRTSGP